LIHPLKQKTQAILTDHPGLCSSESFYTPEVITV
jgi:hypothetical protein